MERKRRKAAEAVATALAVVNASTQAIDASEVVVPDQREKSGVATPPAASPPRDLEQVGDLQADSRKTTRRNEMELKVYAPQWGVLETDNMISPAPDSAKDVGPDLCRGLILPVDRPSFDKVNDIGACTEMLAHLSMVSSLPSYFIFARLLYVTFSLVYFQGISWAAVVAERVEGMQARLREVDRLEVRAVKAEEDLRNSKSWRGSPVNLKL